jgi:hypothetical protein
LSKTYQNLHGDQKFFLEAVSQMGEGHYAQDVVRWENLTLQTQMFAEITRVAYDNWLWPHMLDGAVGLGPFDSDKASSDSLNFLERLAA